MSTVCRPRRPKQRTFVITFTIDGQPYTVSPLDCEPSIGSAAFRFHKHGGDDAVYDLYLGEFGWQCQCKGFLRHGHCKHVESLLALQKAGRPRLPETPESYHANRFRRRNQPTPPHAPARPCWRCGLRRVSGFR